MRTLTPPTKRKRRRPQMAPSQANPGTPGALKSSPKSQHTSLDVSMAGMATASAAALMSLRTGCVPITQLFTRKGVCRTFTAKLCHKIRALGPRGVQAQC